MESLTIGQLAQRAHVGVETVRFYEREGLIEEPPRRSSGYRDYPLETVTRIVFMLIVRPNSMKSVIMSLYLMSVAAGNEFTAIVNLCIERKDGSSRLPGADYYWFFTGCMLVASVGFLYVVKTYKGKSYIQDSGLTAHALEMEADAEGTEH